MGLGKLSGNVNVCVNCLGNRLKRMQCILAVGGVCLEGVLCTIGGSGSHVLIAMQCFELNQADEMFWIEVWELHALFYACM